jgi:hypothetical protein
MWSFVSVPLFVGLSYYISTKYSGVFVSGFGIFLSLLGMLISVFGFFVAILQIIEARGETEVVSQAVQSIKRQFNSFEIIAELRSCKSAVEETISHITDRNWLRAINSYNSVRVSLIKLASVRVASQNLDSESLKDFGATMLDACEAIEKLKGENEAEIPAQNLISALRKLQEYLIGVEYAQKDGIDG